MAFSIKVQLFADNDSVIGGAVDSVMAGNSFYAQILVGDFRSDAVGLIGFLSSIEWNPSILESLDDPFNPDTVLTANFPEIFGGTLDNTLGRIGDLEAGALPAFDLGQAIGVDKLEPFATLHFLAKVNVTASDFVLIPNLSGLAFTDDYVNNAPLISTPGAFLENSNNIILSVSDPNPQDTVTFAITGGVDQSLFTHDSTTGQLTFNSIPDFENPIDSNQDNIYEVQITAHDNFGEPATTTLRGLTVSTLNIQVANVNETPTNLILSNTSINENVAPLTVVGDFSTTDPDTGNTFTYTLISGAGDADNHLFTINSNQLKISASPDFETKSSYSILVKTTDQGGLSYEKQLTINGYYEPDLPAVLQVRLNLLADNNGTPGEIISNDQIGLNRSFFVEIQVADLRINAAGVNGLGLNLAWDGLILESIDTPFDPANIITANFPLLQDGTVDNSSGLINNLSGGSLPAFDLGQAIGVNQLERFALLRFQTENSTGTYYFTTTVDSAALADDNPYYSLDVETSQPILIGSVYSQYNFTYRYNNRDSYTGYVYAVEGTYTAGQVIGIFYNETTLLGNYGEYIIDSIASTTLDSSFNNLVYVTSYTDGDTGYGTTTNISSGTGYSGLGSEYGYAYDANGNSFDPYFSQYYEADILGNQKYNFTYSYGNGDSYSGYGYAAVGTYTAGQTIGGIANETNLYPSGTGAVENNNLGFSWGVDSVYHLSYTFTNVSDALTLNFIGSGLQDIGNESWGLDNVKVTAGGFNYSNDFESNSVTGWSSSTRSTTPVGSRNFLGEFGNDTVSLALNDVALNGSVTVEFDLFIINSWDGIGNWGAGPDEFTVNTSGGQTLLNTTFANNPGQLQSYPGQVSGGYYTINSVELGNTNAGYNGYVYVTSYTDGDTGYGTTTNVSHDWQGVNGYGGLGSEGGYAYDSSGNSSDSSFSQYYEADIQNQLFNYTYTYGNGDSHSGYGYALAGTYTAGQTIGSIANETGYTGQYTIDSVSAGTTDSSYNNSVYVTSYTDGDTLYGETTYVYSIGGGSGLGSEYGYAYTAEGNSYDSLFGAYPDGTGIYKEADLVIPGLAITDNSGNANDSSIKFTTELSKFRKGYQDSDYVRPNYADTTKYFDITNTGTGILVVSDIQINVGGVTVNNLDLSGDKDLLVNPGSSQRVNLTYDPSAAKENFNVTNGLVLFTNVPNWSQYEVALSGKSTFNSDINYDGKVNTGDLGSLNQARTNFNKGIFDATTDINGDGLINTLDASALTADIRLKLSV